MREMVRDAANVLDFPARLAAWVLLTGGFIVSSGTNDLQKAVPTYAISPAKARRRSIDLC